MKKCNKCGRNYPDEYIECPFCKSENKNNENKNLIWCIVPAVVAWVCVVAIVVTSIFNFNGKNPLLINKSNVSTENIAELKDNVIVLDIDDKLEKSLKEITYNSDKKIYTLYYKKTPEAFMQLNKGDLFVVPANEKSDNYNFSIGFSGYIKNIDDNSVSFEIPTFSELFNYFSVDAGNLSATNMSFTPAEGVELDDFIANNTYIASIGANTARTNKFTFGDYSTEVKYKKANTESKLPGYNLIAKELGLKIKKKAKTADNNDIEISGNVSLKYPAVKFNMVYDGEKDNIETYDVGFIANQSAEIKVKGTANVGISNPENSIGKFGIVDLKDTSDIENGKIVLGSLFVGYQIPFADNIHNRMPIFGLGFAFQVCLTANGKVEIECAVSESGLLKVEADSSGKKVCELKNSICPNPVLGEEIFDGESFDDITIKSTTKGTIDINAAISVDVCFSVLGTIPIKLSNDIINFDMVTAFSKEENSKLKIDVVEDSKIKNPNTISYYQFKSQSVLKINLGADFKICGIGYEIGELGLQFKLWSKVWLQYPKPVKFSIDECDFGGIKLKESYTLDQINEIFYNEKDKVSLSGKLKDRFLQSTIRNITNKLNFEISDITQLLPIDGNYDIVCFSDGAIYFLEDNVVVAELITGDGVYNNSHISHSSDDKFVKKVYSEPKSEMSTTISIGEIGVMILKEIDMESLAELDGTSLSYYRYSADDGANMNIYFDGSGNIIFIVVY